MPRKKLTRTQVKRKYKTICNQFYDLMIDKMGHPGSEVGMSLNKLIDVHKGCTAVLKRMK